MRGILNLYLHFRKKKIKGKWGLLQVIKNTKKTHIDYRLS